MLNRLVIGTASTGADEFGSLMSNLRLRLIELEVAANRLLISNKAREIALYGPYIGRAYLETAATALLARLDSYRVLSAKRHQDADYYEAESRSKSAIKWHGDILSPTKPPQNLWSVNIHAEGCRSLLGPWAEELIWIPAFEKFSDAVSARQPRSDWVSDLSSKDPKNFCKELGSSLDGLFSKFSKGVHSELLGERLVLFDPVSVEADFRNATQRITCLSLLSHFGEAFRGGVSKEVAIQLADRIGGHWK